jgi:hypothetical protein
VLLQCGLDVFSDTAPHLIEHFMHSFELWCDLIPSHVHCLMGIGLGRCILWDRWKVQIGQKLRLRQRARVLEGLVEDKDLTERHYDKIK